MAEELKPCPFCGGKAIIEGFNDGFLDFHRITCVNCGLEMTLCETSREYAISKWNTRKAGANND